MILTLLKYLVIAYVYGSVAEFAGHKFLMHRKLSFLPEWVTRDHLIHHSMYRRGYMARETQVPSAYANLILCIEHCLLFASLPALIALPFAPDFSLFMLAFGVLHFHLYAKIHAGLHRKHPLSWLPAGVHEALLKNHYLHHINPTQNFCVSLLGADYLFGTAGSLKPEDIPEWESLQKQEFVDPKKDEDGMEKANGCYLHTLVKNYRSLWECGHIPPAPFVHEISMGKRLCRWVVEHFVGELSFIGELPKEPVLICSNHSSWKDMFIFPLLTDQPFRILAHTCVIGFLGGIFALPFTRLLGCVPIGKEGGIESGAQLIQEGNQVFICPSGIVDITGGLETFKTGAIRISRRHSATLVPMYIRYNEYPGKGVTKLHYLLQYLITGLPKYRAGATVRVGTPITKLPDNVIDATDLLCSRVKDCDPAMFNLSLDGK